MCFESVSPAVVGNAGTGLQIAGVLGQTLGAYKKSSLEKQGFEYQSAIARKNAEIADMQASDAVLRGMDTENKVRHKTANLKGKQVAQFAARGLDLGTGSVLDILTSTDYMGERDALLARDNANKEAWGFAVQASNFRDNADMLAWRGKAQSPLMDAGGTLLTGAGTVASSWYAMRNRAAGFGTPASSIDMGV